MASGKSRYVDARLLSDYLERDQRISVFPLSGRSVDIVFIGMEIPARKNIGRDFSGTYVSTMSGDIKNLKASSDARVILSQNGDQITGTYGDRGGKIWGDVDGDTIEFEWFSHEGNSGRGEWKLKPDGSGFSGRFTNASRSGTWDLQVVSGSAAMTAARDAIRLVGYRVSNKKEVRFELAQIDRIVIPGKPVPRSSAAGATGQPECPISDAALDAIGRARAAWERSEYIPGVYSTILEAETAAKTPECDSVRAEILAKKALAAIEAWDPADQPGASVDESAPAAEEESRTRVTSKGCVELAGGAGREASRANDPLGVAIFTFTATTSSLFCLPTITTEAFSKDEVARLKLQQQRFIAFNHGRLAGDAVRGGGEYLQAMAYLHGCPADTHRVYAQRIREAYAHIFAHSGADAGHVLAGLSRQIRHDPRLAAACRWIV